MQKFILLLHGIFFCAVLFANPDIQYFQKNLIVQRIAWDDEADVLRYDINIEKETETGKFVPYLTENVNKPSIDVSLEPGNYRYNVVAYDLLGRRPAPPVWASLTVLPAIKPELKTLAPDAFYLDEEAAVLRLAISGSNLSSESTFFLRSASGKKIEIKQAQIDDSGLGAELSIAKQSIQPGIWTLYAQNPGGLEASLSAINVMDKKIVDPLETQAKFTLAQGYAPLILLDGMFLQFDTPWYPAGLAMCFSFFSHKSRYGSIGFEIEPTWTYLSSKRNDRVNEEWQVNAHFIGLQAFIAYQKAIFRNRIMFNLRIGAGFYFLADLRVYISDRATIDSMSGWTASGIGGASVKFFIVPTIFLEAGAEYLIMFTPETPSFLRPLMLIGWTF